MRTIASVDVRLLAMCWPLPVRAAIVASCALGYQPLRAAIPAPADDAAGPPASQPLPQKINGRTVTVVSSTADAATTRAMIQAVGRNAVPPAQTGKRDGLSAACALAGDASDPLVARMELRCNGWRVEFVRLCPNGQCRYDLISRQFLPERPIATERPGPLKPNPSK